MHHLDFLIGDLALILVVAGITTLIFKKIKQPVVLGYILAGFLTGPGFIWIPTVSDMGSLNIWANMGIIFMMFALGLEFNIHKILDVGASAIVVAITVIASMIFIGYGVGMALGWSHINSMFLGGMISMSSTTIILKAYDEMDLKKEKYANLVLGTLIIEDIAAIFMMIILSTISVSANFSGGDMLFQIGSLCMYLVLWLVLGIYLIPTFLKKADRLLNDETLLIVSLGLCLGMVVMANYMGFSSALGAFMAGSILAGTVKGEKIEHLVKPLKDFFGAVFFVSVGMLVDPFMLIEYMTPIIVITIVTVLGQMTFSSIGAILAGQSLHTTVGTGLSMVQIGEFSFIIATLGVSLGVTGEFLYPIVVCVSVITTFLTPIFIKRIEPAYKGIYKRTPDRWDVFFHKYTSEKQNDVAKDEDWADFLRLYFTRTLIVTALMFTIYITGTKMLPKYLGILLDKIGILMGPMELIIAADIMVVCLLIPCMGLFVSKRSIYFTKLWIKRRSNRLPLLMFYGVRIAIGVMFIAISLKEFIPLPMWILIVLALPIVVLITKSSFIISKTLSIEVRFMENLNERALEKRKKERKFEEKHQWLDSTLMVATIAITGVDENIAKDFFYQRTSFGVQIIKILRDGKYIMMPLPKDRIEPGDSIYVLGTEKQLTSYIMMLEKTQGIYMVQNGRNTLREFIYGQVFYEIEEEDQLFCFAVPVTKNSQLYRKSIRGIDFRRRYKGFVIGIERGAFPIIGPNKNMIMEDGDLVWSLGSQKMAAELIKHGLLK